MPPSTPLKVRRQFDQYFSVLPNKRGIEVYQSSSNISDEMWSHLKYYSEVKEQGVNLALKNKILKKRDYEKAWKEFRACMRQAESYYEIARKTPTRSAALLYYYCFLNLIKGGLYIKSKNPFPTDKPKHGLYFKPRKASTLDTLTIKVSPGVFKKFYVDYFSHNPSKMPLNLSRLLGYCTDIGVQYSRCAYGEPAVHAFLYSCISMSSARESWNLVAIRDFSNIEKNKKSISKFMNDYERVDVPKAEILEIFDLEAWPAQFYSFFESRETKAWLSPDVPYPPHLLSKECAEDLNNLHHPNFFDVKPQGFIAEPYSVKNQMPMDELCAIYMIMFSLSNLVRYNPSFLERMLESKDAWMLESYNQYTPETFLWTIIGWIIDQDCVFMRR
jgi:hypothetical protein